MTDEPVKFELAQISCETGGWSDDIPPTPDEIRGAQSRWADRSLNHLENDDYQCGGCHYFAATGMDYGICWNEKSPLDGCVCFEHGGCHCHSDLKNENTHRDG